MCSGTGQGQARGSRPGVRQALGECWGGRVAPDSPEGFGRDRQSLGWVCVKQEPAALVLISKL